MCDSCCCFQAVNIAIIRLLSAAAENRQHACGFILYLFDLPMGKQRKCKESPLLANTIIKKKTDAIPVFIFITFH
jgi:hypothetical protein